MSKFGDLIAGGSAKSVEPTPAPVVKDEPTPKKELKNQSKVELEEYGRTVGIELDRRKSKDKLIQELIEHEGKTTL